MATADCRFPKSSRLYLKRDLDALFQTGKSMRSGPVTAIFRFEIEEPGGIKAAFSVPKRMMKLATDRNRIKRRMREAFRQFHHPVSEYFRQHNVSLHVIIVYNSRISADFDTLKTKIILILQRLAEKHEMGID